MKSTSSLRSRRLEVMGVRKNGALEGDTRGERVRLPERPAKIVSRPLSNYLAALRSPLHPLGSLSNYDDDHNDDFKKQ